MSFMGMYDFQAVIDNCNLQDLRYTGLHFTWNNKHADALNIQERLDKFLANLKCTNKFPIAKVTHLSYAKSDHRAIKINSM